MRKAIAVAAAFLLAAPSALKAQQSEFVSGYCPLVEEYTGLECVFCPRGYVMLEQMKQKYGSEFVAISYHSELYEHGGGMVCLERFPQSPSQFPQATVNRSGMIDPLDVPAAYEEALKTEPIGDVNVDLYWEDESQTVLVADLKARFNQDIDDSLYLLSAAIVADGLSNDKWLQKNAYSDYTPEKAESEGLTGDYWDLFIGKGEMVQGLTFNDVAVYFQAQKGISGSLPKQIKAGEIYECRYTVDKEDLVNVKGECIISDFGKLRAVAMIINRRTLEPVNCRSSQYVADRLEPTSVEGITSDPCITATNYYDLQGRPIARPSRGLFIREDITAAGERKVTKIIL